MPVSPWLRFPVVSQSSEYLVMGHLMRRNVLTYKAPPGHEGYDLICVHPNPHHRPHSRQRSIVRVQVKSRFASDSDRGFPVSSATLDAFDFLTVVFLNIGKFGRGRDGSDGAAPPLFYTLPARIVRRYHDSTSSFEKLRMNRIVGGTDKFKDEFGFELIAKALGVPRPTRDRRITVEGDL